MKTIIATMLMIAGIILLIACSPAKNQEQDISVMKDVTEEHQSQPRTEDIFSIAVMENIWDGVSFRFRNLTNVSYNNVLTAKLPSRNRWLSNEIEREKEVDDFKSKVTGIMDQSQKDSIGMENSSVYFPIATELNRMSAEKEKKHTLLVFSDLMEHTPHLSFYDPVVLDLIKNEPDSISKILETLCPLMNLNGIEIYLVFKPADAREDESYGIVSKFYHGLFSGKGATVHVLANIE